MKFVLVTCNSTTEKWSELASDLYQNKISHLVPFEIKNLKLKKNSRGQSHEKVKADSAEIQSEIQPGDYVVLFDETGSEFDSVQYSKKIQQIQNLGKKRALFVIGGAFGVTPELKARADLKVCLSKMVMNHLVAETVALEQLYRALTILKNLPYHNS